MKQTGVVKWFSDEKGYGFIEQQGRVDTFVHYSGIDASGHRLLTKGDLVEFYVEENKETGRPVAVMVRVVNSEVRA